MIINLDQNLINKCEDFAIKRIKGSADVYRYRGENNRSKMVEDVIIGTLGEWAVYEHLKSLSHDVTEPDMKIYEKRRKSFAADLSVDEVTIHVKSQGTKSAKRYGNSWLLQRHDKVVTSPEKHDMFAFVNVNLEDKKAEILGYCWAKNILYGECKVPRYRNTKVAVYLKDLEDLLI